MSTETTYPPLTADEFRAGCGHEYRGIPLCEDEYGHWVYAYGHVDKAEFAAAVNEYDEEMGAESSCTAADVKHRWAVTTEPADGPDGWWMRWSEGGQALTSKTPNAFAISVVSR